MTDPAVSATNLLARRGGRRGLQAHVLGVVAAATGAALLLVLLAFYLGAGNRAERTAWLTPHVASDADATMVQVRSAFAAPGGGTVVVVDLATLTGRTASAVPPGLAAFPAAGQVFVSPALATLMDRLPRSELAGRFGTVTGTIGAAGLAAPGQLLVVVGHRSTDLAVSAAATGSGMNGSTRALVSDFAGTHADELVDGDRTSVVLAVGLVVVPIVVLAGAAGRLGASRREQRLAALRLAGGTPRQILTMAGYEGLAVGGVGALSGIVLYAAAIPLLARFPLGIGRWFAGDLWVGVPSCLITVVVVALMTAVSAVTMLGRVVGDPLGVARREKPRRTRLIRIVVAAAALGYVGYTARGGDLHPAQIVALTVIVYGAFWIAGPWVVGRIGALTARLARRPPLLLAGRRLLEDPHAAWRTVSGLVLAGLLAGFVSIAQLGIAFQTDTSRVGVSLEGTDLSASAATTQAAGVLARAGLTSAVIRPATDDDLSLVGGRGLVVTVTGGETSVEKAATALSALPIAARPTTSADLVIADQLGVGEYAAVALGSLALGFVVAVVSTLLTSTADVLDRRETYRLLRRAGAPLRVLTRARAWQTALPLVVLAGGSTAAGVYAGQRVNAVLGASVDLGGALSLGICVAGGVVAMLLTLVSSRGLLARMTQGEGERRA